MTTETTTAETPALPWYVQGPNDPKVYLFSSSVSLTRLGAHSLKTVIDLDISHGENRAAGISLTEACQSLGIGLFTKAAKEALSKDIGAFLATRNPAFVLGGDFEESDFTDGLFRE